MSLDLITIDPKKRQETKDNFFKKYNLPTSIDITNEDTVYDFLNTATYNRPHMTLEMQNWCQELADKLDVKVKPTETYYDSPSDKAANLAIDDFEDILYSGGEVDSYHIGDSAFSFFREELAPYCNAKYYYAEYDSLHNPILNSYMFQSPDEWKHDDIGKSLFNFFMHSDCDGTLNQTDVKHLRDYLKQHHIYQKMQEKSTAPRKKQFLDFLKWIENQKDNVYWKFS